MITRIARGDVVRVNKTGEVGTVAGIADHDGIEKKGTLIDVKVSGEKTIVANGNELDFVANAPLNKDKKARLIFVVLLSIAVSSMTGLALANAGVAVWFAGSVGAMVYPSMDRMYTTMFLRPRKTSVRRPKQTVANPRRVTR